MSFATITEAIAAIEGFTLPGPGERETLPPRARQQARFPVMPALLALLGNPHAGLRVAHVTGTSGKGSTATMLAALLRAAGLHVGLYTNPYVVASQERVQIDGTFISDAKFIACAEIVADAVAHYERTHPHDHVHVKGKWVALAFLAFARAQVDVAVVEVGMGGRFDETNVVQPAVALITSIGYDHTDFLGGTLAEIAWHKAGIIKPGALAITAVTDPVSLAVIEAEAQEAGAPLARLCLAPPPAPNDAAPEHGSQPREALPCDFWAQPLISDSSGSRFHYEDGAGPMRDLHVPLLGAHQVANAALALRAARHLIPTLDRPTAQRGLDAVTLPGRFEVVAHAPTVVLDVAHNPDKIRALVATLHATQTWARLWIIFGVLGNKDAPPMLAALAPLGPRLIVTAPSVPGRDAHPATHLAEAARAAGIADVTVAASPAEAVARALAVAAPDDLIVITGSLFLVSALRPHWRE